MLVLSAEEWVTLVKGKCSHSFSYLLDTELGTKISVSNLLLVALALGPPLDVLYTTRKPHTPYAIAIT